MKLHSKFSEEELTKERAKAVADYVNFMNQYFKGKPVTVESVKFTCDDCPLRYTCEFVFDTYNMDGDCLAEK